MPTVVIPAYNEEKAIADVVSRVWPRYQVIVVDDGSQDHTGVEARRYNCEVIRQDPQQGCGLTTLAGIRRALAQGAETIVTLDADGQHRPEDIPRLLEALQTADLVIGQRVGIGWSRLRIVACWLFDLLTGIDLEKDSQSGFKAMTRETAELLTRNVTSRGFAFCSEMLIVARAHKLRVAYVPIPALNTEYSLSKPHRQKWFHGPRLAWEIARLRLKQKSPRLL